MEIGALTLDAPETMRRAVALMSLLLERATSTSPPNDACKPRSGTRARLSYLHSRKGFASP
jgi:hypothetical protein